MECYPIVVVGVHLSSTVTQAPQMESHWDSVVVGGGRARQLLGVAMALSPLSLRDDLPELLQRQVKRDKWVSVSRVTRRMITCTSHQLAMPSSETLFHRLTNIPALDRDDGPLLKPYLENGTISLKDYDSALVFCPAFSYVMSVNVRCSCCQLAHSINHNWARNSQSRSSHLHRFHYSPLLASAPTGFAS